jgi:hypothetical protein
VQKYDVYRYSLPILALVLFSGAAALFVDEMDAAFWVNRSLSLQSSSEPRGEAFQADRYVYGADKPIDFGSVADPLNAYFRLKFRFRSDDPQGHADIFRSATSDGGVRVEIDGTALTVFMPEKPSISPGVRTMPLTTALQIGRWYELELEAEKGAFVRAKLDGRPTVLYGGKEIAFETSKFLIGGHVDPARPFKGELADLYLVKGNLAEPPLRAVLLVFAAGAALIAAFLIVLWYSLGGLPAVRTLIAKVLLLALPLVVILGYFEYRLSLLNSIYFYKRILLERQIDSIEVLVNGSSNTFYGVNPEPFSRRGFNLAFPGHGMFYDAQMIRKFAKRMPALRMVVLTVNFFTLGIADAEFGQSWRSFFDRQYFGLPTNGGEGVVGALKFWFEPRNFSKIALYGDTLKPHAAQDYKDPVEDIIAWRPSGWFDAGTISYDPSRSMGPDTAKLFSDDTSVRHYEENLHYWDELIDELKRTGIAVAIVELPTDASFHTFLDPKMVRAMRKTVEEFAKRHGVRFVDYTGDPRFSSRDFSWELVDHMNASGANKFGKILDEEIIQPELK